MRVSGLRVVLVPKEVEEATEKEMRRVEESIEEVH